MFFLGLTLSAYAALVTGVYFGQRRLIYPIPRIAIDPVIDDAQLETIAVPETPDVLGLHFKAPAGAPTLLHFHGNGEQLADLISIGRALSARGLGFFAMEYPGYGKAAGEPSEEANYAAAERCVEHLEQQHGIPRKQLVLQGQSLGTGIAIEMARRGYGKALIAITPYTSMVEMGKLTLPIFPNEWLVHDRYENARKAAEIKQPTLIIHGTDDEVIPVRMGRRLSKLLPNARLLIVEGGQHNDLFIVRGHLLLDEIAKFSQL